MKKGLRGSLAGFLILTALASCHRHSSDAVNDCIARFVPTPDSKISATQLDSVNLLFSKNNLSTTGLGFINMSTGIVSSPSYSGRQTQIAASQFFNGLPAFGLSVYYNFDSAYNYMPSSSYIYTGATPDNDTIGHQNLETLRQIFLNNYKNCAIEGGAANSGPTHPTKPFQDTCLLAVLGYADASIQNTGIPYGTQRVKAWMIYPADFQFIPYAPLYPSVIVIDGTGQAIPVTIAIP